MIAWHSSFFGWMPFYAERDARGSDYVLFHQMMSGSKDILPLTDAIRTTPLLCNFRRAKNIRIPLISDENRFMLMF